MEWVDANGWTHWINTDPPRWGGIDPALVYRAPSRILWTCTTCGVEGVCADDDLPTPLFVTPVTPTDDRGLRPAAFEDSHDPLPCDGCGGVEFTYQAEYD